MRRSPSPPVKVFTHLSLPFEDCHVVNDILTDQTLVGSRRRCVRKMLSNFIWWEWIILPSRGIHVPGELTAKRASIQETLKNAMRNGPMIGFLDANKYVGEIVARGDGVMRTNVRTRCWMTRESEGESENEERDGQEERERARVGPGVCRRGCYGAFCVRAGIFRSQPSPWSFFFGMSASRKSPPGPRRGSEADRRRDAYPTG